MRKINQKNQELLESGSLYGLNLLMLRQWYPLQYILNLFRYIKKEKTEDSVPVIYPRKGRKRIDPEILVEHLVDAGFVILFTSEDFIDEDTGEIITIPRYNISLKKINGRS